MSALLGSAGQPAMLQRWHDLLFLHAAADPAAIERLLPPSLAVETFPDASGAARAWIGLIPFRMTGVRPRWAPPLPWLSAFPETNLRTYVRPRDGGDPGVWFFSLDAGNALACRAARAAYSLPYFHARMDVAREGSRAVYRSDRLDDPRPAFATIACEALAPLPASEPGTLQHFLVERYRLYAARRGRLLTARVRHAPYALRDAQLLECHTTLPEAAGLASPSWSHVCFCDGVEVEVFGGEAAR